MCAEPSVVCRPSIDSRRLNLISAGRNRETPRPPPLPRICSRNSFPAPAAIVLESKGKAERKVWLTTRVHARSELIFVAEMCAVVSEKQKFIRLTDLSDALILRRTIKTII